MRHRLGDELRSHPKNLRVSLDVTNLFNRNYDEGAFNTYVYPGAPRIAQLGISYTY